MATLTNNLLLQGLSGKLGNIVVRQLHGKTIVQAAPVRKMPATPAEQTNRDLFKRAAAYAKEARQDAALWEIYTAEAKRRGGTSNAFAVAVSDFRKGLGLRKGQLVVKQKKQQTQKKKQTDAFQHILEPVRVLTSVSEVKAEVLERRQKYRMKWLGLGVSTPFLEQFKSRL